MIRNIFFFNHNHFFVICCYFVYLFSLKSSPPEIAGSNSLGRSSHLACSQKDCFGRWRTNLDLAYAAWRPSFIHDDYRLSKEMVPSDSTERWKKKGVYDHDGLATVVLLFDRPPQMISLGGNHTQLRFALRRRWLYLDL